MARYKAEKDLFVGIRMINAGEEFESDDVPGKYWLPVDDEGHAAVARRPAFQDPRHAALLKAREAKAGKAAARAAVADLDPETESKPKRGRKPTGLKGRKGGQRTKDASSAKDRPVTEGKPVAEQHTDGEEPTRD